MWEPQQCETYCCEASSREQDLYGIKVNFMMKFERTYRKDKYA